MSEMIERVAIAIATLASDSAMKHNLAEINQADQFEAWRATFPIKITEHDRAIARAAIEAMREPTRVMMAAVENDAVIQCGLDDCNKHDIPENAWRLMIDAALTCRDGSA